jgi:hypothetical protein
MAFGFQQNLREETELEMQTKRQVRNRSSHCRGEFAALSPKIQTDRTP